MLNATQTTDAINDIHTDTPNQGPMAIIEAAASRRLITAEIEKEFQEFLAHSYTKNLSNEAKALIWKQACAQSNGGGYHDIEDNYCNLVDFIKKFNALPVY